MSGPADSFAVDAENLCALVAQFGSPLYVYELEEIRRRAAEIATPAPHRVLYSLKANPLPEIASTIVECGCGFEVSSLGELDTALEAGSSPEEIVYTGPGKSRSELAAALERGVRCFSIESLNGLRTICALADSTTAPIEVLLRINQANPPGRAGLAMAAPLSQFGIDEAVLLSASRALGRAERMIVSGFHVYTGTQIPADSLGSTFNEGIAAVARVAEAIDVVPEVVDVGGGFPWPYALVAPAPDPREVAHAIEAARRRVSANFGASAWFETGRYLVASSGVLITTVTDVKTTPGGSIAILDAGVNVLGGLPALGRLRRPDCSAVPLTNGATHGDQTVDLAGPLCTPVDILARGVPLGGVEPGMLVAIPNVGAYGLTASLIAFLKRPTPLEVVLDNGAVLAVRRLEVAHRMIDSAPPRGAPN